MSWNWFPSRIFAGNMSNQTSVQSNIPSKGWFFSEELKEYLAEEPKPRGIIIAWHNVWKYFHHPQISCALHLLLPQMPHTSDSLWPSLETEDRSCKLKMVPKMKQFPNWSPWLLGNCKMFSWDTERCWLVTHQSFPLFLAEKNTKWC